MAEIISLIIFFWIPVVFVIWRNVFWDIYQWQVKEYRFDRMWSHLLSQEESKGQSMPIYTIKVISLLLIIIYFFFPNLEFLLFPIFIVFVLYSYEALLTIESTIGKRLIKPKVSIRNAIIMIGVFITTLIPFAAVTYSTALVYDRTTDYQQDTINNEGSSEEVDFFEVLPELVPERELVESEAAGEEPLEIVIFPAATLILLLSSAFAIIVDITTPLIVSLWVLLTEPFAQFKRSRIIKRARKEILENKNLKVVGITGSFGKTTTKEILYQILKSKFNTAKTPKNYNSAVGVALATIEYVNPDTEVFIAEMGAYTKSEVKDAADVAKPDISIVTGVDHQHVSLFGSIENIVSAKFEIIDNAKKDAVAIVNGDNQFSLKMVEMTDKKTRVYFTTRDAKKITMTERTIKKDSFEIPIDNCLFAEDVKRTKEGIKFTIVDGEDKYKVKTNIRGLHFASNFLAAIIAAQELGLKTKEIVKIINETDFQVPYMNVLNGLNNTQILDDGYNANATGFLAAMDEMKFVPGHKKGRKIIMTKGIIELGEEKEKIYKKIAAKIVDNTDGLITSDKKLRDQVKIIDPRFEVIMAKGYKDFIKAYTQITNQNDVVLIEGSMNPKVLQEIIDKD